MDIMFEIVSRQKHSASFPIRHVFGEAGGYIGRADECEWVLPDRSKHISRRHALITFENGNFFLEDVSTNGVFLALGNEPVGKGTRHKILHNEGFVIGGYTLVARSLHDPAGYATPSDAAGSDILSFSQPLSLNPLEAMDQEEEKTARGRLGEYDDLLRQSTPPPVRSADHGDPRIATMPSIVAVPDGSDLIAEDWDSDPVEKTLEQQSACAPAVEETAPGASSDGNHSPAAASDTDIFFKTLGFAEAPESPEERARILQLAAQLLATTVGGLACALRNRNECKNELRLPVTTTSLMASNNPLKFSPTPEAALATLLGPPQKGVLPPAESMREGFDDLHSHHMGLMAGARAAVRASLERISPSAVETRLDANGPVRLNRTRRLWRTFTAMHRALRDDHTGFAALFLDDFTRAYEVQVRTLNPSLQDTKRERS
jgi:type VI secretion system protein ImpI